MPKVRARLEPERMQTAKLWDLCFKVWHEVDRDFAVYGGTSRTRGELKLLASIMAELRVRASQGRLEV